MDSKKRVILVVMDGCGAGMAPDAKEYGDCLDHPSDTLVHVSQAMGGLELVNLARLGLKKMLPEFELKGEVPGQVEGGFGRLKERSMGGKDTVTGHWEMMGICVRERFPTYPDGFPQDLIDTFSKRVGRPVWGNRSASGTEIIKELGEKQVETEGLIVYTSADSVFQIAAHEEVVPIEELYSICLTARDLLKEPHNLQRVIARPFLGEDANSFWRTERRKDFPLNPPQNLLDLLQEKGLQSYGIGVIPEVFAERGFAGFERTQSNPEHHRVLMEKLTQEEHDFLFVNFEDFDMLFGHRNDPKGFAEALEAFDSYVGQWMKALKPGDLLLLTSDHGNDPTIPGTDHSREYAPLLAYHQGMTEGVELGDGESYADLAATISEYLVGKNLFPEYRSFLSTIF